MMVRSLLLAGSAFGLALFIHSTPALAQDASAEARHSTLSLTAAFTPDPQTISVTTGDDIDASALASGCTGNIGTAPDVVLTYTAGSVPLSFDVTSSAETSLLINAPGGAWFCSSDSSLMFGRPESGRYAIWIAAAASSTATLDISSAGPE